MDQIEQFAGVTPDDYDPARDSTHLAIPLAIAGETAAQATARAGEVGEAVSALIDGMDGVRWVTSKAEGAYALLANATAALGALSTRERLHVLTASPVLAQLRALTALWVIDVACGHPVAVAGAGTYLTPMHTPQQLAHRHATGAGAEPVQSVERRARPATLDDLRAIGDALERGCSVIADC